MCRSRVSVPTRRLDKAHVIMDTKVDCLGNREALIPAFGVRNCDRKICHRMKLSKSVKVSPEESAADDSRPPECQTVLPKTRSLRYAR